MTFGLLSMFDHSEDKCIEWTGALANGYGVTTYKGKKWGVHRLVMFMLHIDEFDEEMDVLHKCDNKKSFCKKKNGRKIYYKTDNKTKDIKKEMEMKNQSKLTKVTSVRILRSQAETLESFNLYRGVSASVLLRVLLEEYFDGRIPHVEKLIDSEHERSKEALKTTQFKKSEETAA